MTKQISDKNISIFLESLFSPQSTCRIRFQYQIPDDKQQTVHCQYIEKQSRTENMKCETNSTFWMYLKIGQ